MPFKFNSDNYAIEMACGDTANIRINISCDIISAGDMLLFAIFKVSTGEDLLCKSTDIVDGVANIRLSNQDTRDIPPGSYKWNLRLVTSPVCDEQGKVCVDEPTDDVITIFDKPPVIKLTRGGAYV